MKPRKCAFCGQRHSRLLDAIIDRIRAGEWPSSIAEDMGVEYDAVLYLREAMRLIEEIKPKRRKR